MSRGRLVVIAVAMALSALSSGCVTVQPYERELLAHPAMEGDEGSWGSFSKHIEGARESALDPGASGGGSCGCN